MDYQPYRRMNHALSHLYMKSSVVGYLMLNICVSGDCDFVQMDDGWLAISTADCSHMNDGTVIKTNCEQRNPVYVLDVRIRKQKSGPLEHRSCTS